MLMIIGSPKIAMILLMHINRQKWIDFDFR